LRVPWNQVVKRAKIAVLGPLVSMNNPVRIAEESAMLDQLSHGRLVVLFLRGSPNESLAYGTNPDERRARNRK
jgi:alkanesulfonate monooxygenase SsuD/methylene tetrahydromethanopterin reductase-like flavin-dependent oxidoreductase (luciferase family)